MIVHDYIKLFIEVYSVKLAFLEELLYVVTLIVIKIHDIGQQVVVIIKTKEDIELLNQILFQLKLRMK